MLYKTRGIVLRFTKYGETSIIVTIFTEVFGLQSYIVNGVRSKSARNKIALFQPLTLLSLVVYHRDHSNIERIKELQLLHPYQSLTADVRKSGIAMFLTELLNKTVKEESHAAELFEFLRSSMLSIDALPSGAENSHLVFMMKLSRYLGFGPQFSNEVLGAKVVDEETEKALSDLLQADFGSPLAISNAARRNVLDVLLKFYMEHLENFGEIRSVQVLRDIQV